MFDPSIRRQANRLYGGVIGIVVDNNDPTGRYRVKVKYPWVMESSDKYTDVPDEGDFLSNWARISTMFAGSKGGGDFRGSFFLPEIDDEVLIIFEHGDVRRPVIVGSLWNGVDKPIHDNASQDGKNNFRSIRSRSGHIFTFHDDDEAQQERIILQTKVQDGEEDADPMSRDGHLIVIDHSAGKEAIRIYDRKKQNYVEIDSTNDRIDVVSAQGDINIAAPVGTVTITCKQLVTVASQSTTMQSGMSHSEMAGISHSATAGATMNLTAGAKLDAKAGKINLN